MTITASRQLEQLGRLAFRVGCPKEQIGRFLSAGYTPQPKQLEFHAAASRADRDDGPDRIGYGGTRGQAKSHAVLAQAVIYDMARHPALKGLYLRKIAKRASESFEDLRRKVLKFIPHQSKQGEIKLGNGSTMILGGFRSESEIDSYLGLEYDLIILEDATSLTKSKYDAICGSLRTSRDDWRPRLYASANPGGVGHGWFRQVFVDPWIRDAETTTRFIHTTMGDNVFIDEGYGRYLNGLTGWLRRAWRDGDFTIAAGQFFTTWNPEIHVRDFTYNSYWTTWTSLDYGFVHWLGCHLIAQDDDGKIYFVDEFASRRWLVAQNADGIKAMLNRYALDTSNLTKFLAGHDVFARRGTDRTIADEYKGHGISLQRADIDRINGAGRLLSLLGNPEAGLPSRLVVHPRCAKLIEQMPAMQVDPNRSEDVLKVDADPDTGEGGDDFYDCARYGVMGSPRVGNSVFTYSSYGKRA